MKKEYIKPELMVEELATIEMIAGSLQYGEGDYDTSDKDNLSVGRRGKWGDLWFTEQD